MKTFLKEQLRALLWGSLLVLLGWLLLPATNESLSALQKTILNTLSPKALLGLSVSLGLVATLSWAYTFWIRHSFSAEYRKKAYPRDASGLRYDRKDGTWICPRCFDRREISPLTIRQCGEHTHAECRVADCHYYLPQKVKIGDVKDVALHRIWLPPFGFGARWLFVSSFRVLWF
ncbi:MAG: hypothetical protein KIS67_19050 [Verrucomicrobiae bacterium]|nr:hypothetical protein [Verrucomicrobiae bacterium]MCW5554242.1 hypothetical protein [Verrucomicrobiae bacterium]